jgi:hemoglobin
MFFDLPLYQMRELENLEDIKLMVDTFYTKVRANEVLGPIFNNVIQNQWEAHLEKMYRFWQTVLLEEHTYFGSPFAPHAKLPVQESHFETWVKLFQNTVDENFHGENAEKAKLHGRRMAQVFNYKIDYLRNKES